MKSAVHVGRVGSLAVFLGIGSAVLLGAGTASADDAGTASESAGHESSLSKSPRSERSPLSQGLATVGDRRDRSPDPTSQSTKRRLDGATVDATEESTQPSKPSRNHQRAADMWSVLRTHREATGEKDSQPTDDDSPGTSGTTVPVAGSDQSRNKNATVSQHVRPTLESGRLWPGSERTKSVEVTRAPLVASAVSDPGYESNFTGRRSLVQTVFIAVLRVAEPLLSAGGANNALTSSTPPRLATAGLTVASSEFEGIPVYSLQRRWAKSDKEVLYLHGGGYVSQPLVFQWMTVAGIARRTGATVVVPIYPLAGQGGTAQTVIPAMADLASALIEERGAADVSMLGDSAGGGMALAVTQEQVRRGQSTANSLVLLSPWLDVTLSDPRSREIDDPLLDADSLINGGKLWADSLDPTDPWVSPLYGSLEGLPPVTVYSGSLDLLSPDTLRLQQRAISEGVPMTFVLRRGSVHGYDVFGFLPEALSDRRGIYHALGLV